MNRVPTIFVRSALVLAAILGASLCRADDLDAWSAVQQMGIGINIGNTFDNTTRWETGWGNPPITKAYVESLARLGFKTVRLPVAWDTYARNGRIDVSKLTRVGQVIDWITGAGMFCVVNIHWDGGWIDSSQQRRFPKSYATFSAEAQRKYVAYWTQIATHFAGKRERLVFEALNEETNFEGTGSLQDAYATLTRVNQLFIDTVRKTGGNNAHRLLIVTGYATDFTKTSSELYRLPKDSVPHKLLISVHYYTPWAFVGMTEDADWGKAQSTWGAASDIAQLTRLFDVMQDFCRRNDIPAFIGELNVHPAKDSAARVRWLKAVIEAAQSRKMVPVIWDTGADISRNEPHAPSEVLRETLSRAIGANAAASPAPKATAASSCEP